MSAHQIHRMLGVTYKTAWFMCHRIREAMKDDAGPLGGPGKIVEADETFVGGKAQEPRLSASARPRRVVVALVERGGRRPVQLPCRQCHAATHSRRAGRYQCRPRTHLMTDKRFNYSPRWQRVRARTGSSITRSPICREGDIHTNTVENFFSIFKRGVIGTYHHMSEAHICTATLAEFDFRYNTKDITDRERSDIAAQGHRREAPDLSAD